MALSRSRKTSAGPRRRLFGFLHRSKNRRRHVTPHAPARAKLAAAEPGRGRRILRGLLAAVGLLLSTAAVAGGVFLLHRFLTRSPHFAVREIRVPALPHVAADALRARTRVALGQNLFAVDLDEVSEHLRREPWLEAAAVHRELPAAIAVEAKEREAACVVALGSLYLADARGVAWKRANPEEAASFPAVTGIPRARYIHDRETSQALVREALAALAAWRAAPRAPVGEIHVDPAAGVTLYTKGGCAVHVGRGDAGTLAARLRRVDAVLAALARSHEEPGVIYADQAAHPERITVRLRKST